MKNGGDNGFKYPYKALSPVDNKRKEFLTIDDVYEELIRCYKQLEDRNISNISEQLYVEHFFFCNTLELLDRKIQLRIKEYNYSKAFNCPPYPSIINTPAKVIDDFLEIEYIMINIKKENNG